MLDTIYGFKTEKMNSGELLKKIYEEERNIGFENGYMSPYETACAMVIKDIKAWLFLNPFSRISTYTFRKQIDLFKKKFLLDESLQEYPTVSLDSIDAIKEILMFEIKKSDEKNRPIFEQIYTLIFGDFDE